MRRALLAAFVLTVACAPRAALDRSVRRGEPAAARVEEVPVCGFKVRVALSADERVVEGELLAASPDAIVVAGEAGVATLAPQDVREVRVDLRESHRDRLAILTTVGSISTISHGFFLVFTLPAWLAAGIPATVHEGRSSAASGGPTDPRLREFARFPQGLPAGWERTVLSIRPCDALPGGADPAD